MSNRRADIQELDFPNPYRGIYKGSAYSGIPRGYTLDVSNMLPWDALGRQRPSKRPGTVKYFNNGSGVQFGGGGAHFIQYMGQAAVQDPTSAGSGVLTGVTTAYIIIVCNGRTYKMKPSDTSAQAIDGGSAVFSTGRIVDCATFQNVTYFTDGDTIKKFNHGSDTTLQNWTASAGSIPTVSSTYPRGMCVFSGRLVLCRIDKGNAATLYFSAQLDASNFEYAPTIPTPAEAIATDSNYRAGQLGDPVTALMPVGLDTLYLGLDHSIYVFQGDPGDGGKLMPVSETVGVLSKYAWCEANGSLYFLGTGGFYKLTPGLNEPRNLSQFAYNSPFENLPQTGYYTNLCYDRDRHGIWIFITKQTSPYTTSHVFYDLRSETLSEAGGFWPVSFPANTGGDDELANGQDLAPTHGPTRAIVYDGYDSTTNDRIVLMGGRDGYVRAISTTTLNDDGTAISSYCWHGPLQPGGPTREGMINGMWPVAAEQSNFNLDWTLQTGPDPYTAYANASQTATGSITTGGRQSPLGTRLAGNSFWLKQANTTSSKTHGIERWTVRMLQGGMVR